MTAYATRSDVYRWLPGGVLDSTSRLAATSLASTDVIELDGHGFETGDELTLRATEGGSLPAPLVDGTTYYAIRVNNSKFKVSLTANGPPVDITSNGVSVVVMREPPFDDVLEFYSRFVDGFLPGHLVPLDTPIPVAIKVMVAELSAKKLLNLDGKSSDIVNAAELVAKAQLERWAKGIPLRDANATASANRAVTSVISSALDPRGWGSGGVLP